MDVIVQVSPEALRNLRINEITKRLRQAGSVLEPLHPGSDDPTLQTYFYVRVSDGPGAARVLELLKGNPLVEAAYLKPAEGPP